VSETFGVQIYEEGETFMYRENAGGEVLVAEADDKPFWNADTDDSPSPYRSGGMSKVSSTDISMEKDSSVPADIPMLLFISQRSDEGADPLSWSIPVSEGEEVDLKIFLIENEFESAGSRVFDILVDEQVVEADVDIYQEVGAFTAMMKTYQLVSDGSLDIAFASKNGTPSVAAIEIARSGNITGTGSYLEGDIVGVYPNPFRDEIFIEVSSRVNPDELVFSLYTATGRSVPISMADIDRNEGLISLQLGSYDFSKGMIYLSISTEQGERLFNYKIIKE
jgi:hypothetical protein